MIKRLAALAVLVGACGSEPAAPVPSAQPAHTPTAPEPAVVSLAFLQPPEPGHAVLALPARATGHGTVGQDPALRTWVARFGRGTNAAQLQLGERDAAERATLAFYGRTLAVGRYDIAPATDETVGAGTETDRSFFTVQVALPGRDLRSVSGTVEITVADAEHLVGTVDVVLKVHDGLAPMEPSALGRFDAAHDQIIDDAIEDAAAVRAQLRARHGAH